MSYAFSLFTKHTTKYDKQTLCKFCQKKKVRCTFFHCKTFEKEKNSVVYIFSTNHSAAPQHKGFNDKFTERTLLQTYKIS